MALNKRQMSPQSKIRQRKGFVTATRVPDCFERKASLALTEWTVPVRGSLQRKPRVDEYANPKAPVFRVEKEIEPGMKDLELRIKPDQIENPYGLSVFE